MFEEKKTASVNSVNPFNPDLDQTSPCMKNFLLAEETDWQKMRNTYSLWAQKMQNAGI